MILTWEGKNPYDATGEQEPISVFSINPGATTTALALVFGLVISAAQLAQAQTFKVIHTFTGGGDGANPVAGLTIKGSAIYGTAYFGGHDQGACAVSGCGTVYKIAPSGTDWLFTRLYPFTNTSDGAGPNSRVTFGPDGTLYGTTYTGNNVFNLKPPPNAPVSTFQSWTENDIHQFGSLGDGSIPAGDLAFDQAGNLYGTTYAGGIRNLCSVGCGTVYQLAPSNGSWTETLVYQFTGQADGYYPLSGVILDQAGNLYGTAQASFYLGGWGSVFQLTPSGSGWTENTLYDFQGGTDGKNIAAGLIFDAAGDLYGAAASGGAGGGGTIYELSPLSGSWNFNLLYSLSGGKGPVASLIMDASGNLYGTNYSDGAYGYGSVFELTPSGGGWTYASLYDFTGGSDGANPAGTLVMDASGNLFGTTYAGGNTGSHCDPQFGSQCGVVFEIMP